MDKSSKTKQQKKSLVSIFAYLVTSNFLISTQIWDFCSISWFSKILSFKLFGNSWGNSNAKFAKLDIKFPFTCGESDMHFKYCKVPEYYDQDCRYLKNETLFFLQIK